MFSAFISIVSFPGLRRLLGAGLLGLAGLSAATAQAQQTVDPQGSPNDFAQTVANNTLNALKQEQSVKAGNLAEDQSNRQRVCIAACRSGKNHALGCRTLLAPGNAPAAASPGPGVQGHAHPHI